MGRVSQSAEGYGLIIVLDTAGVIALAPIDEQRRARLRVLRQRVLRQRASDLVVPAAVLAEGVLTGHVGHDFHVRRLFELVDVADVDKELGYSAGSLRQAAIRDGLDPPPSGVDAIVAALADARAAHGDVQVITSDEDEMELLVAFGEHPDRIAVLAI